MALPVINTPTFELILPSTGKTVKYRPFLVKEQKAMLIAQESGDASALLATLYSVIDACTFNKLDVEKLSKFDIEYIFVKLRAKSVGEWIELIISCKNCDHDNNYTLNLDSVEPSKNSDHSSTIKLSDSLGLVMRYPTYSEYSELIKNNTPETVFELLLSCIVQVFDTESVTMTKDITREELTAWVEELDPKHYDKIEEFFRTQPRLITNIDFECSKCKEHNHFVVEGIDDFFG